MSIEPPSPGATRTTARFAGSEPGVGGWVNDVAPEKVAQRLRELEP